jgi:hypothetical protein
MRIAHGCTFTWPPNNTNNRNGNGKSKDEISIKEKGPVKMGMD